MTVLEAFRFMAGEFQDADDGVVETWIALTAPLVSRKQFGKLYEQAVALLAAHRMKMAGKGRDPLGAGSIGDTLRVSSYTEGQTSISFGGQTSGVLGEDELSLTVYGLSFLQLRRLVIVPIHCSRERAYGGA